MRKLYEKREVLFAVLWILAYCLVIAPLKGKLGFESAWMPLALLLFAAGMTAFIKANRLEGKYGLRSWPKNSRRFLYFLPMLILAAGNLWDGFAPSYHGLPLLFAVLSMLLIGYVEELLFRGFLFKALLSEGRPSAAIVISALSFGMGHIVNLLTGQGGFETLVQILFAVAWGFMLTLVFYKSGSLLPCVLAHVMIDVFSLFGKDDPLGDWICVGATVVFGTLYCLYLRRLKTEESHGEQ